jgi:hypothetical protein
MIWLIDKHYISLMISDCHWSTTVNIIIGIPHSESVSLKQKLDQRSTVTACLRAVYQSQVAQFHRRSPDARLWLQRLPPAGTPATRRSERFKGAKVRAHAAGWIERHDADLIGAGAAMLL